MDLHDLVFVLHFFLTNIIFSFILLSVLFKFNKESLTELSFYSLGLGPVFTSLILYYLFLLIPHQANIFYLLIVFSVYAALAYYAKNEIISLLGILKENFNRIFAALPLKKVIIYSSLSITLLTCIYIICVRNNHIYAHDPSSYAAMGKIYAIEKKIDFGKLYKPYKNGFYNVALHAPSYSLMATWERLLNGVFNIKNDLYFRSVSVYYNFLIIVIMFFWLRKKDLRLAYLGIFAYFSGFGMFYTMSIFHIDSFRIFFFTLSWIFLVYSIQKRDDFSIIMLGVFSGFSAYAHSIGAIVSLINVFIFLIFYDDKIRNKIYKSALVFILYLLFGGIHYFLDNIYGKAWILKYLR